MANSGFADWDDVPHRLNRLQSRSVM